MKRLIKILGPGLLYAGAAIGVSHVVQSTRAGAGYGFYLIWILLLVNIIKYPFFEFASRYSAATKESLIDGYRKLGLWAIIIFTVLTVSTMFAILAAVALVTDGLLDSVFTTDINALLLTALILGSTTIVLIVGRYAILDKIIKFVIVILAISTIIALVSAFGQGYNPDPEKIKAFSWHNRLDIIFLIAFIGWMPAPFDLSVWSSLWTKAKLRLSRDNTSIKDSLLDFRIGYIGTVILATCFLLLGAFVMHGTDVELSPNGTVFARQLISMYTTSIGEWAYPFIAIAAITTMYSTTLTAVDAYPRVLTPITWILFPGLKNRISNGSVVYWFWMIIVVTGTLLVIGVFSSNMGVMVDIATTLSFLTAPVLAIMNYKVVTMKGKSHKDVYPSKAMKIYAWIGMIFLTAFTAFYIIWRLVSF